MKIIGFPKVFFDFLYQNQRSAYKTNGFEPKNHAFHTFLTFHTFCGDSFPGWLADRVADWLEGAWSMVEWSAFPQISSNGNNELVMDHCLGKNCASRDSRCIECHFQSVWKGSPRRGGDHIYISEMGPYGSISAHIKTGKSPMAYDHF